MNGELVSSPLIGCCGWGEAKAKYFAHFHVVELQTTFYEPPSVALASKWRALVPADFQICMKAWQLITHTPASPTYRRLKSRLSLAEHDLVGSFRPTEQVFLAWERTSEIAEALRARVVLFQCPASFRPERENLTNFRAFFSEIKRRKSLLAWEPRGAWPANLVEKLCRDFDLIHCVNPLEAEPVYGEPSYWRLHGKGGYKYRYSDEELAELKRKHRRIVERDQAPAYILFNNVYMKQDALRFQQLFTGS